MACRVLPVVIVMFEMLQYLTITRADNFYKKDLCDVQARVSNACMTRVSSLQSMLNCCVRCNSDSNCLGASLQVNTSSCYLHTPCSSVGDCSQLDTGFKYFEKKITKLACVYGTWNETSGKCKCQYPKAGTLCDRQPYNCSDFAQNWPTTYGPSMLQLSPPPLTSNVIAICDRTTTSLSTVILRNVGELDFNRTWDEYVAGFLTYPPPFNLSFWVGIDAMRAFLGPNPKAMRVNIVFNSTSPSRYNHRYTGVIIGDASTNFLLKYDSHQDLSGGGVGYCLELSNMTSFSTWDSDYDGDDTVNWASRAGAGWWFPAFNFTCNPLGSFYSDNTTPPSSNDGYLRFSGVSTDLIKNNLVQTEVIIEEPPP